MPVDFEKETLWQEQSNSLWYSNKMPECDVCGKKTERVLELKIDEDDEGTRACFLCDRDCTRKAINLLFAQNPEIEYTLMREIEYKAIGMHSKKKRGKKREPVGLSKRYDVMKRDGFQCVLCGASGKDAQLEIDHILPVSAGGSNMQSNLQTLCFKCNRGKRDKTE